MKEDGNEYLSIEELTGQQVRISIITVAISLLIILVLMIIKPSPNLFLSFSFGVLIGIGFHWWLYHDLKKAITLESTAAVRYASTRSMLRNLAQLVIIVVLIVNRWIDFNIIALFAGILLIKPVVYFYNLKKAKENQAGYKK